MTQTAEVSTDITEVKKNSVTPINQESPFGIDELFCSVTNPLSEIEYANDVFIRVSKFTAENMVGQYHNIIRHPDMPMAAFRIMWEHLLNNKSVSVYVKNMAKDGSYYWVMALAFPVEGGYLSIRLKPTSPMFEKIKRIYKDTRSYEMDLMKSNDREYTIKASKAYMLEQLAKEGFDSYDKFMKFALQMEVRQRELALDEMESKKRYDDEYGEMLESVNKILGEMVVFSDKLEAMHEKLLKYSNFILHLSNTILSIAINARLQSSKLDQADQSLSVISEKMGEQTQWGEESLKKIIHIIEEMYTLFGNLNFDVISSKVQVEMALLYLCEYHGICSLNEDEERNRNEVQRTESFEKTLAMLKNAYEPRLKSIQKHIGEVPVIQNQIQGSIKDIEKYLTILRFIYITGKVEITRMSQQDASFQETFEDLIQELETADEHLSNLRAVINENNSLFNRYSVLNGQLRELVQDRK